MIYHETECGIIHCGDSLDVLSGMADESVDCCITSPPYWGLRDYGCDRQLGLEKTPEEYVANMVQLFREVRRVLKDDGVLWLNLGDSYAGSGRRSEHHANQGISQSAKRGCTNGVPVPSGLKSKDLVGIPWRVAFALQADGWWLRQDIIWHKPNPMPESVTDRCTKAHEYVFLMSKSAKYYYDNEAVKEKAIMGTDMGVLRSLKAADGEGPTDRLSIDKRLGINSNTREGNPEGTRNKRSVWTVTTKPYKEAHFATYPPDLILPCVKTAKPDAVILDPFFGSGTTGLVAVQNGRRYIGIDLNPEYCAIAAKRIDNELQQADIFMGLPAQRSDK